MIFNVLNLYLLICDDCKKQTLTDHRSRPTMSDSAIILLNDIARGFRDSVVGIVRVYQVDRQPSDEGDSGEGSAGEETPTVLARRRAARNKRTTASLSKDRFG